MGCSEGKVKYFISLNFSQCNSMYGTVFFLFTWLVTLYQLVLYTCQHCFDTQRSYSLKYKIQFSCDPMKICLIFCTVRYLEYIRFSNFIICRNRFQITTTRRLSMVNLQHFYVYFITVHSFT